jgi:hypothetical protein
MPCTLTNIAITKDYAFKVGTQTNECDYVTPTNAIAPKSMSMALSKEFIDASGARGTHEVLLNDYLEGNRTYEGEVSFPGIPNFLPAFLVAAYGSKTTNGAGTNMTKFRHDNDPKRLSLEGNFGRTNIIWKGCVVNEIEFSSSPGAELEVSAKFMAIAPIYTNGITSGINPTRVQRAFQHSNATVTVYGTSLPIGDITLTISRPNVTPWYGVSLDPDNLIVERPTEVKGTFTLPWSTQADTIFDNFRNFTTGQITLHYARGTNTLRFTMPQVILEEAPNADLSDMSVSNFEFSFRALAPTNQDACKIELTSAA